MSIENKAVVRRWVEYLNAKKLDSLGDVWGDSIIVHGHGDAVASASDLDSMKKTFEPFLRGIPDVHITIEALIAEDDLVVGRFRMKATHTHVFMGYAPSGKPLEWISHNVYRVRDGKIVEEWVLDDMLALMKGVGAVKMLEPNAAGH